MNKNNSRRNVFGKISQSLKRTLNLRRKLRRALPLLLISALVIVPLTTFGSASSRAQKKRNGRSRQSASSVAPDHIFQNCPFGCIGIEDQLENQAINDVLALHQLAPTDRARLLADGRNEIRAMLFTRLYELIKKDSPTAAEQQALATLAYRIKQKRVEATTSALSYYQTWKNNPCTFTPPSPLTYEPGPACGSPLAGLFAGPISPDFEEFQQMGVLTAYGDLDTDMAQQAASQSARNLVVYTGGAAVGLGGALGVLIGTLLPQTVFTAVFPFVGTSIEVAAQFAGRAAITPAFTITDSVAGGTAIGGPVTIIIIALTIAITRTIDVVNASQVEGKLQTAQTEAQNATLDLRQLITNNDAGLQELYGAFILTTLPEVTDTNAPPPPSAGDRQFIVHQNNSSTTLNSPTISYLDWNLNCHTARQNGAWFIDKDENGIENLKLSIEYIDWYGLARTASRSGIQFILTTPGLPDATQQADEIQYQDCTHTLKGARIKFEQLTATGDSLVTVGCPLDPDSAQSRVIGSVAGTNDSPASLNVTVNDQSSATINGITVSDLAVNSQYQITANVFVPATTPVKSDFTLKVRDAINLTSSAPFTIRKTAITTHLPDTIPSSVDVGLPNNAQLRPDTFIFSCGTGGSTISITDGALPNGLSLQPDGQFGLAIKGTPTAGGQYQFTVTEIIGNGETQSRSYAIFVRNNLADLPSGMTSWWRGEGNTDDFTNLHNGSLFGSAGFASGIVNTAFKFNGANGYVALPNDTFEPSLDFTYELWFKTSGKGVILGRQRGVAPYETPLQGTRAPLYVGSDGKLRTRMFGGDGETFVVSPNRVDDNVFHHVAVAHHQQAQTEQVYLDGNLIGTLSSLQQGSADNFIYQLGTGYVSDSNLNMFGWFNFNGLVDEPTLYNRPLTANEVKAIFTAGGAGKISVVTTPVQPTARDGNDGSITVTARGGTPRLLFSKDNGATFQEANTFKNLTPGDYQIVIKDGANRIYTRTVTVVNPPPTLGLGAARYNPICAFSQTGRIVLYATGTTTGAPQYSVLNGANAQSSNVFEGLAAGTYTPWVKDPSGTIVTGPQIVLTNPPELTLSPAIIPDAIVGQPYSQTFTSNGGIGSRRMFASNLPAGFNMTSTASGVTVSGTPQQAGTLTFFVNVKDDNGCTSGQNVNLNVTDNCPAMMLAPAALPIGVAGQAYTATEITPTSGAAPFSFSVTGLPGGMNYNPNATATTLVINGTPQQSGVYPVTVTATSANGCTRNISYTLVINRAGNPTGQVLISEARTSGPNGPDDEFVELYNNTDAPVDIHGWALTKRGFNCATEPQVVALFPQQPTYIPARGHYLITGSAYSLGAYATSNATLAVALEDDTNLALFTTNIPSDMTPNRRQDALAFGTSTGNYCDLLREGNTLPTTSGSTTQYSFVRQIKVEGTGAGKPLDTGDNATDFALVSTDASIINGTQSTLGAPGPQNAASPVLRENVVVPSYIDPLACGGCAPNRVRTGSGNSGTLAIRRHFTNQTNAHVTQLRFRVIDITTLGSRDASPTQAQLKVINSSDETVTATLNSINIKGTTLEAPTQAQSGGLNSSLTVQLPGGGLEAGGSIDLQWVMQVVQNGRFRFFVSVEALP